MKTTLLTFILCLFIISCSHKVQYIGRTYEPTSKVEIFFTSQDVKKDYEIMGKIEALGIKSYQKMQAKIMAEAERRGADAILISELINENNGVLGNCITTTNGMRTGRTWTGTSATLSTITTQSYRFLYVDFIKYK